MARIFVLSGSSIGSTFDVEETSTIGRGDGVDLQIQEASISRTHARLVPRAEPGQWKVIDLNSSNGVFIGGKRVKSGIVSDGDTFRLGDVELRLRDESNGQVRGAGAVDEAPDLEVATHDEFELEFHGDLDEALAPSAPKSPRPSQGVRAGTPSQAASSAARDKAKRRQAALGGAGASLGSAANPSGGGKPVLQYSARNHRTSGADISQLSAPLRWAAIALALLVAGAAAYGAFTLTKTARSQSAVLSGDGSGGGPGE